MSTSEKREITIGTKFIGTTAGIGLSLLIGGTLLETFTLLWRIIYFPGALVWPEIVVIIYLIIPCILVGGYVWLVYYLYICRFVGCLEHMERCFPMYACKWVKIYVPIFIIWCIIVRIVLVAVYPAAFAWMSVP